MYTYTQTRLSQLVKALGDDIPSEAVVVLSHVRITYCTTCAHNIAIRIASTREAAASEYCSGACTSASCPEECEYTEEDRAPNYRSESRVAPSSICESLSVEHFASQTEAHKCTQSTQTSPSRMLPSDVRLPDEEVCAYKFSVFSNSFLPTARDEFWSTHRAETCFVCPGIWCV
jgi:hypothetical protein